MRKIFKFNVIGSFILGLVFITTSLLSIIIPSINNRFDIVLIPFSLSFLLIGIFIMYVCFGFYKSNEKNVERLTPEEKDKYYNQGNNQSMSQTKMIIIVWSIFAGLFGSILLLISLKEHNIGFGIGGFVCFVLIPLVIWGVKNAR